MNRKEALKTLALLPLTATAMKLHDLDKLTDPFKLTPKMPVLFFGHGSPMNAIEQNEFSQKWQNLGKSLPRPAAILCISAHWETRGTYVTAMEKPSTIHDFGGFPQALFDVEYPAPGSPQLALETKGVIKKTTVGLNNQWGLDHGSWSVTKNLYPLADVPIIQMSIDYEQSPLYHYELAKELAALRKKGVLIIGSGNIVHNLGLLDWQKPALGFDWAIEANEKMKKWIIENDHQHLINYKTAGRAFDISIPTPEHYLPMLYTLALKEEKEQVTFFNDKTVMGSISMTSLMIS